jgi:hypothetical protein
VGTSSGSATAWLLLGLLALAIALGAFLLLRGRGKAPESLAQAYAASTTLRDELARQVTTPPANAATVGPMIDDAERALRAVNPEGLDEATRSAVQQSLRSVVGIRDAIALRGAVTEAAPEGVAAEADAALLRSLGVLDASLGPLGAAARGEAPPPPPTPQAPPPSAS